MNFIITNYKYFIPTFIVILTTIFLYGMCQKKSKEVVNNQDIIIHSSTSSTIESSIKIIQVASNSINVNQWIGKAAEVELKEKFNNDISVPVGIITFNPNNSDKPIETKIEKRNYEITTTVKDNKAEVELKINNIVVPVITKTNIISEPIFAIRPRLYIASTLNNNFDIQGEIGGSINLIKYKSFAFLSPGISYTQNTKSIGLAASVTPVEYFLTQTLSIGVVVSKSILNADYSVGLNLNIEIK